MDRKPFGKRRLRRFATVPTSIRRCRGFWSFAGPIADHSSRFYELEFDPGTEVLVTSGATEALGDCIMGLVSPGDEAVVIEPCYDSYRPMLSAMGAKIRDDPAGAAGISADGAGAGAGVFA